MAGVGASKARAWRVVSPTRNEAERSAATEMGEVELGEARASGKTRCNNYYHQPKLTLLVNTFRFHSTQDCRQSSISYCLLKRFSTRLQSVTNTIVHTARSPASPTSSPTWPTSSSSAFVSRTLLLSATTTAPTPATSPAAGQFLNDRTTSQHTKKTC